MMAFMKRDFWQLRRTPRRGRTPVTPDVPATREPWIHEPSWVRIHAVATIAGHRRSGLADAFGGYLCRCREASWSDLDEYGAYGGCPEGWSDAREFLTRYGVKDGAE